MTVVVLVDVLKAKIKPIKDLSGNMNQTKLKLRTNKQSRAMHLFFTLLAEELNFSGYDMRKTIAPEIDIPWTSYSVKEYLWRPIQKVMFGKKSTTQLETKDIDKIFETINRVIGERTGVYVPWPCMEQLMEEERLKNDLYLPRIKKT